MGKVTPGTSVGILDREVVYRRPIGCTGDGIVTGLAEATTADGSHSGFGPAVRIVAEGAVRTHRGVDSQRSGELLGQIDVAAFTQARDGSAEKLSAGG